MSLIIFCRQFETSNEVLKLIYTYSYIELKDAAQPRCKVLCYTRGDDHMQRNSLITVWSGQSVRDILFYRVGLIEVTFD
jgi:hypothetical protein